MIEIDKYAYNSRLSNIKAAEKVFFAALPGIICLFGNSNTVCVITLISMCVVSVVGGGYSIIRLIKILLIPSGFLIIGVLTVVVTRVEPALAEDNLYLHIFSSSYGITEQSLSSGIALFLRALAMVSCLYFLSLNTPMNSILNYFRRLKLPGIIIELTELIYRFIFVVWNESVKIRIAQKSRLGYKDFKTSLKSMAELVAIVFIRAMKHVENANIALESRGFDGNFSFLVEEEKQSMMIRCVGLMLSAVLFAIAVMERVMK